MTSKEILIAARELISDPEHWCKGCYAKRKDGSRTFYSSGDAYSFCAFGALYKVAGIYDYEQALITLNSVLDSEFLSIPKFNDVATHREILALYDKAIASLP